MNRFIIALLLISVAAGNQAQQKTGKSAFNALVLYENGGHHQAFTNATIPWLNKLAAEKKFTLHFLTRTDSIDENFLKKFQVFIQLDYVPYGWSKKSQEAFIKYIEQGKGGWVGLHHASLLGDFDGYTMWPWFHAFMGNIRFKNYIPTFAGGEVVIEDSTHPVVQGLPQKFWIEKEEWYVYDKSPRPHVRVIAHVDEKSYKPSSAIKMGDHPVIWSNEKLKARNLYIFMGHDPGLLNNSIFTTLFTNAILWAAHKK